MNTSIVAAGHEQTANAAAEILRSGGNAFDAAISAMYVMSIVEPALASLGGGGFLMAHKHDETPVVHDFFVQTPRKRKTLEDLDARSFLCDFGSAQQEFLIGSGTSAVPGYVKGIFEIARRYCTIPMTELIQPALDVLRDNIVVDDMQAYIFRLLTPIFLSTSAQPIYESRRNPGNTIESGEAIEFPDLSDLLETLAIEGDDLFYRGEIATAIHDTAQAGGLVDYDDLANYQVELRHPIATQYRGHRVFLNPAPSSGGILTALGLSRLRSTNVESIEFGASQHLASLLDTLAACDTLHENAMSGDAEFDPELVAMFRQVSSSHAKAPRGTTHISVIDRDQNAAAVSVSNGEGCGTLIPGTAIMMNNMLGEHDVNPAGLTQWPADTRLSSMMAPTVALSQQGDLIATGSGGSNRIPAAILQVLINLIDFNMPVADAVRAPRLHYHKREAFYEDLFESSAVDRVIENYPQNTRFDSRNVFFGGVHTARYRPGQPEGFGDDRRNGVAIVV
ncbi:MAG: gamma-glutamyltransferase [Acidiferrobacterales bacterium]|nr:gamma-glutamyltransferase [Acidiferrobacterales bacterium]